MLCEIRFRHSLSVMSVEKCQVPSSGTFTIDPTSVVLFLATEALRRHPGYNDGPRSAPALTMLMQEIAHEPAGIFAQAFGNTTVTIRSPDTVTHRKFFIDHQEYSFTVETQTVDWSYALRWLAAASDYGRPVETCGWQRSLLQRMRLVTMSLAEKASRLETPWFSSACTLTRELLATFLPRPCDATDSIRPHVAMSRRLCWIDPFHVPAVQVAPACPAVAAALSDTGITRYADHLAALSTTQIDILSLMACSGLPHGACESDLGEISSHDRIELLGHALQAQETLETVFAQPGMERAPADAEAHA